MGFIYYAESPSGKAYVGQTRVSIRKRWNQHVTESNNNPNGGCHALNAAIRKYGKDSFYKLECIECPNEELDEWESIFIDLMGTYYPNGYNLTKGGQGTYTISDESRQRISDKLRVNLYNEIPLPANVIYIATGKQIGFKVKVNERHYHFTNGKVSMDENLANALECYKAAQEGTLPEDTGERRRNPESFGLPTYLFYSESNGAYVVQHPNHKRKTFRAIKNPKRALANAMEYLESLN